MSIKKGAPNEESQNEDMKIFMNINKKAAHFVFAWGKFIFLRKRLFCSMLKNVPQKKISTWQKKVVSELNK